MNYDVWVVPTWDFDFVMDTHRLPIQSHLCFLCVQNLLSLCVFHTFIQHILQIVVSVEPPVLGKFTVAHA